MNLARLRHALSRRIAGDGVPLDQRRLASFPFISGDTFRAACDVVIDAAAQVPSGLERLAAPGLHTVFVGVDAAPAFLAQIQDEAAGRTRLVVHNGDLLPAALLADHAHRFQRVFAVNWLGDPTLVTPLPIGLENAWIGRNGELRLFNDCVPSQRVDRLMASRSRQVLLAFNDSTCPKVRGEARASFLGSSLDVDAPPFLDVHEYHRRLRDVLFVPSPRGNGIDCHRTWEAIYAGAVPIVLRSDWAFEQQRLPVLVVDDWGSAITRIAEDAAGLHRRIVHESTDAIFAWHFLEPLVAQ